ncbi:ribbon-helix-helix domain-containing protein [Jiella sonneratiae]|uniref:Ribbon-helix-helix domain-containing protein n=1 Tax=Jiella sonneratiae TaxID=2816856 RepID=A0ABS3J093_9HYPH|nr:ribbon-helix-helix domain-containing protein [Jiella sonneratiae]MBO0903080.1 ribbon-helix-helix domain-containing protein [Jiella sonneratiae]
MAVVKRSVSISGHQTSISVEERFWQCLRRIAARERLPLARLIARIDAARDPADNLSSAVRLHVLEDALARAGDDPASSPDPDEPPSGPAGPLA